MSQRAFCFLHAADLHVDRPAVGVVDAPQPLVDLLIDCPRQAAARVFDAAIQQQVDFVILAGDVINPTCAAPREWLFLAEQFGRLAERNIAVYWCGGATDSISPWPDGFPLPGNVRMFPIGRIERFRHEIGGATICEIIGRGHDAAGQPRAYDFAPADDDIFSVAVAHADWNCAALGEIGVDYWALGGAHQRSTPLESNCVAHNAGSPQGRTAEETGPHGCTLVAVDEQRRIRLTPLVCDVLRWQSPRLSWVDSANGAASDQIDLEQSLRQRTEALLAETPGIAQLLTWKIACQGKLRSAIRQGSLAANLEEKLRTEFGRRSPPCWTVAVEADQPEELPSVWLAEDTLRGDFLRAIQLQMSGVNSILGLLPTADVTPIDSPLEIPRPLTLPSPQGEGFGIDHRTLLEAAWLGADLLSPQASEIFRQEAAR